MPKSTSAGYDMGPGIRVLNVHVGKDLVVTNNNKQRGSLNVNVF